MGIINSISNVLISAGKCIICLSLLAVFGIGCDAVTSTVYSQYYAQYPEKLVEKYENQTGVAYPYEYLKNTESYNPHVENTYYVGEDMENIVLIDNPASQDPTYKELCSFLAQDKTNENEYIDGQFTCGEFAERVHNNAEYSGIACAWVAVDFTEGPGHACCAFNTTDNGLVYIDSMGQDTIAYIQIGEIYEVESFFSSAEYYPMKEVTDFTEFW